MFYDVTDLRTKEIYLKLTKTCVEQPEKRWLPAYYFDICLLDGTIIGNCDLRIGHNDKTYIGGNIGYGIDEKYRGHRYAAKACELLFKQAKKHHMDYLIITCNPDNIASYKTCEIAGGELIEIAAIPEDNEMYAEGKRQVKIFKFDI
ncbi:GNAT family N-acetyltransferase [Clostridium sp. AL.422]|uniref:GNAT family N-acetyltransferase n=1 Tax=Clostridium TaxID=1485 RepID=UPI00293DD967|nr:MULTISPECIES: GNAT family N-acetyltransferase [unclassified Clostridium]MDV4150941.1 GNAT family N-acetyltransferase [Clostridium sp. AL.422]